MFPSESLSDRPRSLTLQHAHGVRAANATLGDDPSSTADLEKPKPGYEKLYSFFVPPLAGGKYQITAKQEVSGNGQKLTPPPTSHKTFVVKTPQYSLPDGAVHSVFPANGGTACAETLPHILFTDPYVPWERATGSNGDDCQRAPWLALLAFKEDELALDAIDLDRDNGILARTALAADARKSGEKIQQSPTFSLNLLVSDIAKISGSETPVPSPDHGEARTDVILITPRLFELLTTDYTADGDPLPGQDKASISRYTYLAHVRYTNAEGMTYTNDNGLYSVVLSHRIGPLSSTQASRTIVHLVSLEGWQDWDRSATRGAQRIALSSLCSWSYTTLLTGAQDVAKTLEKLGQERDVLRLPADRLGQLDSSPVAQRVKKRLNDGYTLVKYLTQTGEETAAIMRGPLTPTKQPEKLGQDWESLSFSGSNLQIFDTQAGLMDLTFSSAWTLGKTLALSDPVFMAALARVRAIVDASALEFAKKTKLEEVGAWQSRQTTMSTLADSVAMLGGLSRGTVEPSTASRPRPVTYTPINTSRDGIDGDIYEDAIHKKMLDLAASKDDQASKLYNELNESDSSDWKILLGWIVDSLYLFNIPAHYLLPEPSCLPNESLRFFFIDPHWTDAFIDGALSLANHIHPTDDAFRRQIKAVMNIYFDTVDPSVGYKPQLPTCGVLLRSGLLRDFPDLYVTAPIPEVDESADCDLQKRAPVLRHERLSDDVLLCLFDREPGSKELSSLNFTQPAHQQFFVVGKSITQDSLKIAYKWTHKKVPKEVQTAYGSYRDFELEAKIDLKKPASNRIFIWGENNEARFLNMEAFTKDVLATLKNDTQRGFQDDIATSALVGYQLGCPVYQLSLVSDDATSSIHDIPESRPRPFRRLQPLAPAPPSLIANVAKMEKVDEGGVRAFGNADRAMTPPPHHHHRIPLYSEPMPPVTCLMSSPMIRTPVIAAGGDWEPPRFEGTVSSINELNKPIPTNTGHPIDLVFSVRITNADRHNSDIERILLRVPMGDGKRTKCLLNSYTGPGPVMLSNLRWNVLLSQQKSEEYLDLTLLPRSTSNRVPIKQAADCSFILPIVKIKPYPVTTYISIECEIFFRSYANIPTSFLVTLQSD